MVQENELLEIMGEAPVSNRGAGGKNMTDEDRAERFQRNVWSHLEEEAPKVVEQFKVWAEKSQETPFAFRKSDNSGLRGTVIRLVENAGISQYSGMKSDIRPFFESFGINLLSYKSNGTKETETESE